jgi:hypothetical protein
VSCVVLISHALSYTAKTHNKLEHTCKNHQASSHSNSNAFRNPQSIRFSSQNRSSAVDIQISWIRDISGRVAFRKSQAKAKRIIFDSVKDSIMPLMTSLMITKDCMDTLLNLYEKHAPSQKRTLKHKLKYLMMEKGESIAPFCSRRA